MGRESVVSGLNSMWTPEIRPASDQSTGRGRQDFRAVDARKTGHFSGVLEKYTGRPGQAELQVATASESLA